MSADFLVEIGTEELPPKALLGLSTAFCDSITQSLTNAELSFGEVKCYAAPRRLAVFIKDLAATTPAKNIVAWGPPAKIAFDAEGKPSKAGAAFARKNNLDPSTLSNYIDNDGSQDKLCVKTTLDGVATTQLLADIINAALAALPIPKRMRWGASREEFVRPVHWAVLLYGNDVVDASILSLSTGRTSRGHRFHSAGDIVINSPSDYAEALRAGFVIADFDERRELIRQGVNQAAKNAGGLAVIDPDLLDEVTALNEWPVPLLGQFERSFLDVPSEALISSMKEHQKYFHVVENTEDGQLMPLFITVANIDSKDPSQVIAGNEKVIRPRLSDAAFFYNTDKKVSLEQRRNSLKTVVFQEKLGTIFDKSERIAQLAAHLAPAIGADSATVSRAGKLCKSDLVSDMVLEFSDLQGTMGRYYARNDGENSSVADAMFEHYLPRFAGDILPATTTGTAIALADRIDTLVGIFGIGQAPSGSRDPFALRRASLGVLRILVEKNIDLSLRDTLAFAASLQTELSQADNVVEQVLGYIIDRFRAGFDSEGISAETFMAVQAKNLDNPLDFNLRIQAVHRFSQLPEASALAAANKRVSNILAKNTATLNADVNSELFENKEENELLMAVKQLSNTVKPLFINRDYNEAMQALASLKEPVDNFFDQVMVMTDALDVRNNRLRLLTDLRALFLNVADISLLVPAK